MNVKCHVKHSKTRSGILIAVLALIASPSLGMAQPFVERATPPVVERGKPTKVTFIGHDLAGAVGLWSSQQTGAITAKPLESFPDRAVFEVTATADAGIGVCGMRVATKDGLGNAFLFHVDDLPVRPRLALNEDVLPVNLKAAYWSQLPEAVVHRYQFAVSAGERVSFEVVGNRLGKDIDPLVTIRDASGKWIAERDNDAGLYFDCRFAHTFAEAGSYTIEVRDARFKGNEHTQYVLRMGRFPAGRVAVPAAVWPGRNTVGLPEVGASYRVDVPSNRLPGPFFATLKGPADVGSTWVPITTIDGPITVAREPLEDVERGYDAATSPAMTFAFLRSPLRANPFLALEKPLATGRAQGTTAIVPGVLCGSLKRAGGKHAFTFPMDKGQRIFVRGEAKTLNSPVDLDVVLTDRFGRELRRSNEQLSPTRDDLNFDFTAGTAGEYAIVVRDVLRDGGDAFAYRVIVRGDPFPPILTAEVEGLTVPQGTYQPIPISVNRNGHTGPIKLKLIGAPTGVKLVPDEIDEKETAIVCRLEAEATAPIGLHTLQIVAETVPTEGPPTRAVVQTQPLIDKKFYNVDLILHAMREDQRRLPPSLNDRFAVQITPPATFTMELPEELVTLARYQRVEFPIVTTRIAGFDGPISFTAKGGQLAPKEEGRTRVYPEFTDATPQTPKVNGAIQSLILSNTAKSRIEVTGTGTHQGRRVSLTRTFDLDLTTAFKVAAEPKLVSLLPGESAKVRLTVDRLKTFQGPVTIRLQQLDWLPMPETITIPAGQAGVDLEVKIPTDAMPRRQGVQMTANGVVNTFEEEYRANALDVEVKKVEPPKKPDQPKK